MRRILLAILLLPGLAYAQSAAQRLSQVGHVLNTGTPAASALGGTEIIPCIQGGTTSSCTPAQIKTYVGAATPGGSNTQLQYNNNGSLGGIASSGTSGKPLLDGGTGVTPSFGTLNLSFTTGTLGCAEMPALSGDTTSSAGSCATTVSKVNGGAFPTSATVVGSNASAQPIAATTTGTGTAVVLSTAPTITGFTNNGAGAASTAAASFTGAPYTGGTGTTTYPLIYLNDGTVPTTWNTAGTELGINAPSGFTGNLFDFYVNGGSSVASLDYRGNLTVTSCTGCSSSPVTSVSAGSSGLLSSSPTTGAVVVDMASIAAHTLIGNATNSSAKPTTITLTGGLVFTGSSLGIQETVNAQTGTTYTIASTDCGSQVTFSNASAVAVTVPQATSSFASCQVDLTNKGAGTVTLTPTTSTINGASSLAMAQNTQCAINSDGTNWQVIGCTAIQPATNLAASGSGGVTGVLPVANGGTGTASPGLVAGTNVTITGSWPNQTINSSSGSSSNVQKFGWYGTLTTVGTTTVTINTTATNAPPLNVGDTLVGTDIPGSDTISSFGTYTQSSGTGTVVLASTTTGSVGPESAYVSAGTWTKPGSGNTTEVLCTGAGGGGGSGAVEPSATAAGGGGGGGGGATVEEVFQTSLLTSTVPVTIGIGGNGGAARTATQTGANGGNGGSTTFGSYLTGNGGGNGGGGLSGSNGTGGGGAGLLSGATGGTSGTPGGGAGGSGAAGANAGNEGAGAGGGADASAAGAGTAGGSALLGASGGGAGGGVNTGAAASSGGASGTVSGLTAASGGSSCGNGTAGSNGSGFASGTGGGGGASCATAATNAGSGGNGGIGGGGGGGGANINGDGNSGAGGTGGNGACFVSTY